MKPSIYGLSGITILALSVFLAPPGQVIGAQNQEKVTQADIMDIHRWGKNSRIHGCLMALEYYRGAAKPLLPRLVELEKQLANHREAKMLQSRTEMLRKIIAEIKADENPPKLRSIAPPRPAEK